MKLHWLISCFIFVLLSSCSSSDDDSTSNNENEEPVDFTCVSDQSIDRSRGACNEELAFNSEYSESQNGNFRVITSNSIPTHKVGLFGGGSGSFCLKEFFRFDGFDDDDDDDDDDVEIRFSEGQGRFFVNVLCFILFTIFLPLFFPFIIT